MKKDRNRKANFTDAELRMLVEIYKKNSHVLLNRYNSSDIKIKKTAVWQEITSVINRLGVANRDIVDVRKKWMDLKCHVQKIIKEGRHLNQRQPWYVDTVMQILAERGSFLGDNKDQSDSMDYIRVPALQDNLIQPIQSSEIQINTNRTLRKRSPDSCSSSISTDSMAKDLHQEEAHLRIKKQRLECELLEKQIRVTELKEKKLIMEITTQQNEQQQQQQTRSKVQMPFYQRPLF